MFSGGASSRWLRALGAIYFGVSVWSSDRFSEADVRKIAEALEPFIQAELADKRIPGAAVALVDDQQILWSKGFGVARQRTLPDGTTNSEPMRADTVIRAGSVSKLFNAILVMQQVEAGKLDLDAPVTRHLPDFQPTNRFQKPITLRHLLSHRAGVAREPPHGNYFEPEQPSLRRTVASITDTEVVYEPGARTKYSNAGVATSGYIAEKAGGKSYARLMKRDVLGPAGLNDSSFELEPRLRKRMADGLMWTLHGTSFEAPVFQWGMAPAASLNTTVEDLGRFASALFADADGAGRLLKKETLFEMWRPQFAGTNMTRGFGLGFLVSDFNGQRRISHNGAVFGFATEFSALPEKRLAVAVAVTKDFANTVGGRIATAAMNSLLASLEGRSFEAPKRNAPVEREQMRSWIGRYVSGEKVIELIDYGGRLHLKRDRVPVGLRFDGTNFIGDSELGYGPVIQLSADTKQVKIGNETFHRAARTSPPNAPQKWMELLGEYGWDYDILYVFEEAGKINVLFEWFEFSALEEIAPDIFQFPDDGFYAGEKLVFKRGKKGNVTEAIAANVRFKRRDVGNTTPRIKPVKDVEKLLADAARATPPTLEGVFAASDLVDLAAVDQTFHFDVRYASTNNFLGTPVYSDTRVYLQRSAAEALARVSDKLRAQGYGLRIFDGYRPWAVTKVFWEATPEKSRKFVANSARGSRHNRGAAVDLTLYELATGNPVEMPGEYDEMTDRSHATYPGGTARQRWHRDVLRAAMESEGFRALHNEWWHFDHESWRQYPLLNEPIR